MPVFIGSWQAQMIAGAVMFRAQHQKVLALFNCRYLVKDIIQCCGDVRITLSNLVQPSGLEPPTPTMSR